MQSKSKFQASPFPAPGNKLAESRDFLETAFSAASQASVRIGVILGSGLGDWVQDLPSPVAVPFNEIPHFPSNPCFGVAGHAGQLFFSPLEFQAENREAGIFCLQGRLHHYQGYSLEEVIYPIRLLALLGVQYLIVTNAAGGIHPDFQPGNLMLITDHLNLMGGNPLRGAYNECFGPPFPDMTVAYDPTLRQTALEVAQRLSIQLRLGVYAAVCGPSYETPAEVRMLRTLGADAVGMSTVPEVIAARQMNLRVLGLSCITNSAAGLSSAPLAHTEVLETARRVRQDFSALLTGIVHQIPGLPTHG